MPIAHILERRRQRVAVAAMAAMGCALIAVVGAVEPAAAAPTRSPLVGPRADISCQELEPGDEDVSQAGPGHVAFAVRSGTVTARVVLRGAEPRTSYVVRLLQANDSSTSCVEVNGVFRTNRNGNGSLRVTEPITGPAAQVIVNTGALFGQPTYRAESAFSTASMVS